MSDFKIDLEHYEEFKQYKEFLAFKKSQENRPQTILVQEPAKPMIQATITASTLEPRPLDEVIDHQAKVVNAEPLTHTQIKGFIDRIFNDITGKLPMLGTDRIFEKLHYRFPATRYLSLNEVINVLVKETLEKGSYKRIMVGPNKFAYMLKKASVPRSGSALLYFPDVPVGKVMFYNLRGAILKYAAELNGAFENADMVNKLTNEYNYILGKHKEKFRSAIIVELATMVKDNKLQRVGGRGNAIYSLK